MFINFVWQGAEQLWWSANMDHAERVTPVSGIMTAPLSTSTARPVQLGEQNGGRCNSLKMVGMMIVTDLPTRLYLTILVWNLGSSTDVRLYFSKYGHRVSRKYGHCDMNECEFITSEADHRVLMGSYCSLTFAYFKPFLGLKYAADPDWLKKFVKPMNIEVASKLSWG